MNFPPSWNLKRPGKTIPVFFLCLAPAFGQTMEGECSTAALGNTFLIRSGYCLPAQNQAGLGRFDGNSVSLQHSRPALCPDLGISSISLQIVTSHGALGTMVSHYGIRGLGFTSAWLAYGIALRKGWSAGVGIHFWHATLREKWIHHPCFSFAAGIQAVISDQLTLGAHISHPAGWYSSLSQTASHPMMITVGGAWRIFPMIYNFWELEFITGNRVRWKLGIEWKERRELGLQIGVHNQPFTVSGGISVTLKKWNIQSAFTYMLEQGSTPFTALSYEW